MSFEPADVFLIEDGETFDVLADPMRIEILEICNGPRSVGEIAEAMDVPRTRLYHHVNMMEEKGILAIAETRQKGAMTEKLYQAAAKSFKPGERFLEEATPRERAEAMISSLLGATKADFLKSVEQGLFGFWDQAGKRKLAFGRSLLHLTEAQLDELIADIDALMAKYAPSDDPDPDAMPVAFVTILHPSSREIS